MSERIHVSVRVRPFLLGENTTRCIHVRENRITLGDDRAFAFDHVFDVHETNAAVYNAVAAPLVASFVEGFNSSAIAYGQTGAGKTHTMSYLSETVIREAFDFLEEKHARRMAQCLGEADDGEEASDHTDRRRKQGRAATPASREGLGRPSHDINDGDQPQERREMRAGVWTVKKARSEQGSSITPPPRGQKRNDQGTAIGGGKRSSIRWDSAGKPPGTKKKGTVGQRHRVVGDADDRFVTAAAAAGSPAKTRITTPSINATDEEEVGSAFSDHQFSRQMSSSTGAAATSAVDFPQVRFSALEVYNDSIFDLIARCGARTPSPTMVHGSSSVGTAGTAVALPLREDGKGGVYVSGLTEAEVRDGETLLCMLESATINRSTASTLMNATSSRSHCVVVVTLTDRGVTSKFTFVDLAGSERLKKAHGLNLDGMRNGERENGSTMHGASGLNDTAAPRGANGKTASGAVVERVKEGISINGGLLALGNVITALCEGKAHVPFRSSKLTRLLQPMLSGNSKTAFVACVSPCTSSFEESLNTLKYADRAKSIHTTPFHVVAYPSQEVAEKTILQLRRELLEIQRQLTAAMSIVAATSGASGCRVDSMLAGPLPEKVLKTCSSAEGLQPSCATAAGGHEQEAEVMSITATVMHSSDVVNALAARLRETEEALQNERALTKTLQEDLFNAEYTAMVEVEKRKALEKKRDVASMAVADESGAGGRLPADHTEALGSAEDYSAQIERLVAERDSILQLKAETEAQSAALRKVRHEHEQHCLGNHGRCSTVIDAEVPPCPSQSTTRPRDPNDFDEELSVGLAEQIENYSQQITLKERLIDGLKQQNEEAARALSVFVQKLSEVQHDKECLEEELARAEARLEATEMEKMRRDEQRIALKNQYAHRLKAAENAVLECRRKVKEAEANVKERLASQNRIRVLQDQLQTLKDSLEKQRTQSKDEEQRVGRMLIQHNKQVDLLQKKVRDAEAASQKLQQKLREKEKEIALARKQQQQQQQQPQSPGTQRHQLGPLRSKCSLGTSLDGTASSSLHLATLGDISTLPAPYVDNPLGRHHEDPCEQTGTTNPQPPSHLVDPEVTVDPQKTRRDALILEQLEALEAVEHQILEVREDREALNASINDAHNQCLDPAKLVRAIKGYTVRLQQVEAELKEAQRADHNSDHCDRLTRERDSVFERLHQLQCLSPVFEQAKEQLRDLDERIDNLTAARRFHLRSIRRLQRDEEKTNGTVGVEPAIWPEMYTSGATLFASRNSSMAPEEATPAAGSDPRSSIGSLIAAYSQRLSSQNYMVECGSGGGSAAAELSRLVEMQRIEIERLRKDLAISRRE